MHLDHTQFPALLGPLSHPCDLLLEKKKRRKENKITKSMSIHSLKQGQILSRQPLKNPESFPSPTAARSHQKSYSLASLSQSVRVLFNDFLYNLFLLGGEVGGLSRKPSVSLVLNCGPAVIDIPLQKTFPCSLQSTIAWTMDIHMASSVSTGHRPQPGLQ